MKWVTINTTDRDGAGFTRNLNREGTVSARYLTLVLLAGACSPGERAEPDAPASGSAESPAPAARPAATVSAADFQTLRWLEGTWRGTGGGVDPFFERYRMLDDTTLLRQTYSDSTLGTVSDSARVVLRGNIVVEPAHDPAWRATSFDSVSWRFESIERAGHAFTWRRDTPDRWTAILESRNAAGRPQERIYTLERIAH